MRPFNQVSSNSVERNRERERERQTDRQTDRQTETETELIYNFGSLVRQHSSHPHTTRAQWACSGAEDKLSIIGLVTIMNIRHEVLSIHIHF